MSESSITPSSGSAHCRKCGKHVTEIRGYLTRVNAKGVPGIWECRPSCDSTLSQDEALIALIEGPLTPAQLIQPEGPSSATPVTKEEQP